MRRLFLSVLLVAAGPVCAADHGMAAAVRAWEARNWPQARALLRPLALRGDAAAQTLLGVMAARGLGAPADPAVAAAWYLRAATSGHAPARLALADAYRRGEGVPKDPARAARIEQALAAPPR